MTQLALSDSQSRKRCSRCAQRKPLEDFPRNRSTKDGRQTYCKACYNRVCVNCNNGLGKFEDEVRVMERAVRYLENPGRRVESP